ncbi:MAG TPA: element excision factor XisI family protein [Pirellulales bacterium]
MASDGGRQALLALPGGIIPTDDVVLAQHGRLSPRARCVSFVERKTTRASLGIHVDIRGGKIWIQHDGTEDGIADRLVEAGVPKH